MTEPRNEPDRADLRALAPTDDQAERVIGGVMTRLSERPQIIGPSRSGMLEIVGLSLPPAWIAAAAALAIAGSAAVVAGDRPQPTSIDRTVATWAEQQYVPTNAELLLAFQGYGR